jgi:hypothetical protein
MTVKGYRSDQIESQSSGKMPVNRYSASGQEKSK